MVVSITYGRFIVSVGIDTPRVQFYHGISQGVLNSNADALSRCGNNVVSTAATFCSIGIPQHTLQEAQRNDPITNSV